jgi:hypothetical protein
MVADTPKKRYGRLDDNRGGEATATILWLRGKGRQLQLIRTNLDVFGINRFGTGRDESMLTADARR